MAGFCTIEDGFIMLALLKKSPLVLSISPREWDSRQVQSVSESSSTLTGRHVLVSSSVGGLHCAFDGRGSGFHGTNLLHKVQRRLGMFEEKDQMDALR